MVYPSGDLTDTHMLALVEGYWGSSGSRTSMEIDAMTSDSLVVSVGGYAQQDVDAWTISTEAD